MNPLDISQWTFYVMPTITLDRVVGNQKSITLGSLKTKGAEEVPFNDIGRTVRRLYEGIKSGLVT